MRPDSFTPSAESSANLFCKDLHRDTQNSVLPEIWAALSPVGVTPKINHHRKDKSENKMVTKK